MSLMLQAHLLETYKRQRLTLEELGEQLGIPPGTILNQISAGTFPIPTYRDGKRRWCDIRDLVAYLDKCRESAA